MPALIQSTWIISGLICAMAYSLSKFQQSIVAIIQCHKRAMGKNNGVHPEWSPARAGPGPENKVRKTGQAGPGPGLVVNFIENRIQIKPKIDLKWPLFDTIE